MTKITPLLIVVSFVLTTALQAQNVGISNIVFTPQSYMHVHQPLVTGNALQLTNSSSGNASNAVGLVFSVNTNEWTMRNYQAGNLVIQTGNGNMRFFTNNTERMIVLSSGNVGIGDLTPLALFTVGNGDLFRVESTGHARTINATAGAPAYSFTGSTNTGMWAPAASNIAFSTAGAERYRVNANGQFLVNVTTPSEPNLFEARVNAGDYWAVNAYNATTLGSSGFGHNTNAGNGFNAWEGITAYNLGVGQPAGLFGLAIAGNAHSAVGVRAATNSTSTNSYGLRASCMYNDSPGYYAGYFQGRVFSTGNYYILSDSKLKENLNKINTLDRIMQLNIYEYEYTKEYSRFLYSEDKKVGFIAQEVEELFPGTDLTSPAFIYANDKPAGTKEQYAPESEEILGVSYTAFVPYLVRAIQEQQQIIESLEERIELLEKLILEK
jgi:hypothetical protein